LTTDFGTQPLPHPDPLPRLPTIQTIILQENNRADQNKFVGRFYRSQKMFAGKIPRSQTVFQYFLTCVFLNRTFQDYQLFKQSFYKKITRQIRTNLLLLAASIEVKKCLLEKFHAA